jgi:dTDP-glucose 4,6-dehydratase
LTLRLRLSAYTIERTDKQLNVLKKGHMRILITGGAGFLGSHLVDKLISEDHEIIVFDNLLTGRTDNIEHHFGNVRFKFIKQDVTEYLHVGGALDAVVHFASPASPIDYLQLPIQTLKVGSLGTHKALGLAKEKKSRFLLASTSEVYGDPQVHPQPESYWGHVSPVGPRGVYDEAKRFAEAMTMAYHRYHKLDTRIARIFNTYGSRMRPNDGRVVSNFIVQALRGEPLTVYGDGSQTRSFCYVSDLIDGIVRLLMHADSGPSVVSPESERGIPDEDIHLPVNIGNPGEFTVLELAEMVIALTGSRSKIERRALPVDDPRVRQPDARRARTLLEWYPAIGLKEGLEKTIEYFRTALPQN